MIFHSTCDLLQSRLRLNTIVAGSGFAFGGPSDPLLLGSSAVSSDAWRSLYLHCASGNNNNYDVVFCICEGMQKIRTKSYMDEAEDNWIMEFREDTRIYTALSYSGSAIQICKTKRSAQAYETKVKIGQAVLQDYIVFLRATLEQRIASHFVFTCFQCACHWRSIWQELKGGGANIKSVAWWTLMFSRV